MIQTIRNIRFHNRIKHLLKSAEETIDPTLAGLLPLFGNHCLSWDVTSDLYRESSTSFPVKVPGKNKAWGLELPCLTLVLKTAFLTIGLGATVLTFAKFASF